MTYQHGTPLHLQVADRARALIDSSTVGERLPSDGKLADAWKVSVRTIREALLLLEAEGLVERRRGSGTWICEPEVQPVALFSELNLLHVKTPRFFGIVLDIVRQRLAAEGIHSRLYTGRSQAGNQPGFSCPELIEDAEAGRVGAIVSICSDLQNSRLQALAKTGLPMVVARESSNQGRAFGIQNMPAHAVPYLLQAGRRKIAMIGWDHPSDGAAPQLVNRFRDSLAAQGAEFHPEWCRVEHSFAWSGSAWEEFRGIWFARDEKPDALLVTDENFLHEIIMTALKMHLRVPEDLLAISHQTKSVTWQLPVPVARIEQDAFAYANHLADKTLAVLRSEPAPDMRSSQMPYTVVPIPGTKVPPVSASTYPTNAGDNFACDAIHS